MKIRDKINQYKEDVERLAQLPVLKTGLAFLDNSISILEGDIIWLAGRPFVDLCYFYGRLALNIAGSKTTMMLCSYSDTDKLTKTLLRLKNSSLESFAEMSSSNTNSISNDLFNTIDLSIEYCSDYYLDKFYETLERNITDNEVRVIFYEPMNLIDVHRESSQSAEKNHQNVEPLISICKKHGVTLIMRTSINKSIDDRTDSRPDLRDLSNVGIEDLFDKVIILYKPSFYGIDQDEDGKNIREQLDISVFKNNYGPTIGVTAGFNVHTASFREWE